MYLHIIFTLSLVGSSLLPLIAGTSWYAVGITDKLSVEQRIILMMDLIVGKVFLSFPCCEELSTVRRKKDCLTMPSDLLWSAGGDLVDSPQGFGTWFMAVTYVLGLDVAYGFVGNPKEILLDTG